MQEHWKSIKQQIRERKYKPQPVLRVEIPKPNGGVVDTTDYMRVKQTFLRSFTLSEVEIEAADVEDNDIVDSTDCMRIKSHFLGSYNLFN